MKTFACTPIATISVPTGGRESVRQLNRELGHALATHGAVLLWAEGEQHDEELIRALVAAADRSPQHGVLTTAAGASHDVIAPTSFPVLIRTSFLRLVGLLDDAFSSPIGAVSDFALRANRIGSSTIAVGGFGTRHGVPMPEADVALLHERHPVLRAAERWWDRLWRTPEENFAEVLDTAEGSRRILLDLTRLDPIPNGSAQFAVNIVALIAAKAPREGVEFTVCAPPESATLFRLDRFGLPIAAPDDLEGVFDVAIAIAPPVGAADLYRLNRLALHWVIPLMDVIALRSVEMRVVAPDRFSTVTEAVRWSDVTVAISATTQADAQAILGPIGTWRVSGLGIGNVPLMPDGVQSTLESLPDETRAAIEHGGYVLVIGNWYDHKQVRPATMALAPGPYPVIAMTDLGADAEALQSVHGIPSGSMSDALIADLYDHAAAAVFPSAYEGYGLPLLEAAVRGLPTVVCRTAVVDEVVETVGLSELVTFFDDFAQLPDAVHDAIAGGKRAAADVPGFDGFASVLLDEAMRLAALPRKVDPQLAARWERFQTVRGLALPAVVGLEDTVGALREAVHAHDVDRLAAHERADRAQAELERLQQERSSLAAELDEIKSGSAYRAVRALGDVRARLSRSRRTH